MTDDNTTIESIEESLKSKSWNTTINGQYVLNEIYTYFENNDDSFEEMVAEVLRIVAVHDCSNQVIFQISEHMRLKYAEKTP